MNERIKELMEEAGGYGLPDRDGDRTPALVGKSVEKFAELIVKECVSICYAESRTAGANGNLAEYSALSKAGGHIKDHFGVKE
jgi:hypothetical protein